MEHHRKQAKRLVRAFRDGHSEAVRRAERVLGARAHARFLLSDAQHVVAREAGFRAWPELRKAQESPRDWVEGESVAVTTDARYGPGDHVEVLVRKRGWRFDLSDGGRAVELAGRPRGCRRIAEEVVEEFALNVNRRGVVFVQANEARIDSLVIRVAECSVALYQELLDRELGSP